MNFLTVINAAQGALAIANAALALGQDVAPLIEKTADLLTKGTSATPDDVAALRKLSDDWGAQIVATPIPDEEA